MLKRPLYINRVKDFLDTDLIKIITGQRRVGKSYLLLQIIAELHETGIPPKNIIHIDKENFEFNSITDSQALHDYTTEELTKGDKKKRQYLLVDEIQEIVDFEKAIRSLNKNPNLDITITGSNSNIVSSDIATLLSGRYIEIPVHPLTFQEFKYGPISNSDADWIIRYPDKRYTSVFMVSHCKTKD